ARFRDGTAPPTAGARDVARLAVERAISAERAGRSGRSRRPAVRRLAAVGVAAAAVVAAAVIAPLVWDRGSQGPALPGGLRNAILTAYDAAATDVLHVHQVLTAPDGTTYVEDEWASLSQGGQQVHTRARFSDGRGTPIRDVQVTFALPAGTKRSTPVG